MPSLRSLQHRHRVRLALIAAGVLVLVATATGAGAVLVGRHSYTDDLESLVSPSPGLGLSAEPTDTVTTTPTPIPTPTPTATKVPGYATTGPNTYVYASGQSAVFGTGGVLSKYRVATETGTPVAVGEFAEMVDSTLSDPRSWIAGGNVRLQRVGKDTSGAAFTVYLVTPGTAQKLCQAGGFDIFWRGEPYTSCRVGAKVVINLSRYLKAVPNYGASLESYRRYAINHEVGHALGHGHELCPGKGKPAPVMQQQTFDLQGCVAYFWPYLDGKRYAGPPGRIVPGA